MRGDFASKHTRVAQTPGNIGNTGERSLQPYLIAGWSRVNFQISFFVFFFPTHRKISSIKLPVGRYRFGPPSMCHYGDVTTIFCMIYPSHKNGDGIRTMYPAEVKVGGGVWLRRREQTTKHIMTSINNPRADAPLELHVLGCVGG